MSSRPRGRASLSSVRGRIDRLDAQLLRLVNRRAELALLIGRIKRRRKWPVFDARREAFVLRHVARENRGPLSSRAVARIFQAVLRECRRRERTSKKKVPGTS
ncbi:MAG: chorismate mutase [Candidatus Omnitrophica bacterium]|nr:chorismate mutase [Candidatus Omnitrophota bacterium]